MERKTNTPETLVMSEEKDMFTPYKLAYEIMAYLSMGYTNSSLLEMAI